MKHEWIKSTLGHGETMCARCFITNREAAALGVTNKCDVPPPAPAVHCNGMSDFDDGDFEPVAVTPAAQRPPFAWLIEKEFGSVLHYYAPTEPGEWTRDHLKACRFARKQDAEAIQFRHVTRGHLPEGGTRVCEHGWMDHPAVTSTVQQPVENKEGGAS